MTSGFVDPYREYPYRAIGLIHAVVRPWKDQIPKPAYQLSLGVMHTYFITNSYDYANRVDSTSWTSSFLDCYTWHCAASWTVPLLVVDRTMSVCKNISTNRFMPMMAAYAVLPVASVIMDKVTNWYFYGFLSAGNKEQPRLRL